MKCSQCLRTAGSWQTVPGDICVECLPSFWEETKIKLEKYQTLITQRKTQITQEITLLREILNHE